MKTKHRINPEIRRMMIGAGVGIISFLTISLLAAFILTKKDLSFPVIRYVVVFAAAFSAALAGFIAKRKNRIKGILCGLTVALAVLLPVGLLLIAFNGVDIAGEALLLIPTVFICGATGGVISSNLR